MGDGLISRVTSKELKIFPMELGFFFENLRIFQVEGLSFFIMVEVILEWLKKLLRGVMFFRFLVD